jgi:hypothetical protein
VALRYKIEPDTSDIHPTISLEVCLDDRTDRDTFFVFLPVLFKQQEIPEGDINIS